MASAKSNLSSPKWSRRGTKRCKQCGTVNGQRALICRNEACELRRVSLESLRPFDPIELVVVQKDYGRTTSMYSLRSKLQSLHPRSFVEISSEISMSADVSVSLVSRQAKCYVENCKYDAACGASCKHVQACSLDGSKSGGIPQAEEYPVSREVLWNLNIDEEQKRNMWNTYKEDDRVPAVQRLNATTFAVRCTPSKNFTAGRLHVTVVSNAASTKQSTYACCCKKLKIVVEPDNSVLLENDICDHLLLVLAAILSKPNGKNMYAKFVNSVKSYWMPKLETPLTDDALFGMSINIDGNFSETASQHPDGDDIFIFSDEFLADSNIPDFSDVVYSFIPGERETQKPDYAGNQLLDLAHPGDPNLVSSCDPTEDDDMRLEDAVTPSTPFTQTEAAGLEETHLEFSDCKIELMDQFQLTDQIVLCSDDIALLPPADNFYESPVPPALNGPFDQRGGSESRMPVSVLTTTSATPSSPAIQTSNSAVSLLKPNQTPLIAGPLPPIEMPTIAVVKKCPIKVSEIVTEIKTRKFPRIPARRDLIVNTPPSQQSSVANSNTLPMAKEPSLSYTTWLDHVIEVINDSIAIGEQTDVQHSFHVHEEIFSHFSKTFSAGTKLRMYNSTTVLKSGKHKGLTRYTWNFPTACTVRRIFSTPNISLQTERAYVRNDAGDFIPYVQQQVAQPVKTTKYRPIYSKVEIHFAHILFEFNSQVHKTGFTIEWLPNVLPQSRFGLLGIQFSLGIRRPTQLN